MTVLSDHKKKMLRRRDDYRLLEELVPQLQIGDLVAHPGWEGDAEVLDVSHRGVRFSNTLFVERKKNGDG